MISDILQCRIYSTIGTIHPSGVVFKGVLECQIGNSLSARKWVSKILGNFKNIRAVAEIF